MRADGLDWLTAARTVEDRFLTLAAIGALTHGALYLVLVFAAALHYERPVAMALAIATFGVVYLSCSAYSLRFNAAGMVLTALSMWTGAAAGLALVW